MYVGGTWHTFIEEIGKMLKLKTSEFNVTRISMKLQKIKTKFI